MGSETILYSRKSIANHVDLLLGYTLPNVSPFKLEFQVGANKKPGSLITKQLNFSLLTRLGIILPHFVNGFMI